MYPAFNNRLYMNYSTCPANMQLAHSYVPFQCLNCIYPPMVGLYQGTIFPELTGHYEFNPEDF